MSRSLSLLFAAASLMAIAAPAMAEESCTNTGPMMTREAVTKSLHDRGFTQVRSLSTHNGCWEAKGKDAQGKRFELELNGATGAIVNQE